MREDRLRIELLASVPSLAHSSSVSKAFDIENAKETCYNMNRYNFLLRTYAMGEGKYGDNRTRLY